MAGVGHYNTKGLYNSYDKKHKERDKFDYYATDPREVSNILNTYRPNFENCIILEPCAGEGHMSKAIWDYMADYKNSVLVSTEFQQRQNKFADDITIAYGEEFDFLSDDYWMPEERIDWIVMNPPYATIEPFMIRALDMAQKGVIMLGRIQCLEGAGRYENVFKDNPPTYVYTYVDRIQCWKNGEEPTGSSAQGYSWFIWDKSRQNQETIHRWIRRMNKQS